MATLQQWVKDKALAYVIREAPAGPQVLVFEQEARPEQGIQVPAGTVDAGETAEAACVRELDEEAGILTNGRARMVGVFAYFHPQKRERHRRHVFRFDAPDGLPPAWTHVVSGTGNDRGRRLRYFWCDAAVAESTLAASQGAYLPAAVGAPRRA